MVGSALVLCATVFLDAHQAARGQRDYASLDVCQMVPGEVVARALNGKLASTRKFNDKAWARCTYLVILTGTDKPTGYVVWINPAKDFEELRKVHSGPVTTIAGLGDAAYMFRDEDTRYKIDVLKRGDLMFEATADTAEAARKIADAVVSVLWKKGR